MTISTINPYMNQFMTTSSGLISHFILVRNDATVAYPSPWFTVSVSEDDVSILNVVFNYQANYNEANLETPAPVTDHVYKTLQIHASPMVTSFAGGFGLYDVVTGVGTIDTTTYNASFDIQFYGDGLTSLGVVASPSLGTVASYTTPDASGVVASVSGAVVRLATAADALNFSPGDLVFFSNVSDPDYGTTYTVASSEDTVGTVTFTTSPTGISIGYVLYTGTYSITLVTAGDSDNFTIGDLVYPFNGTFPGEFGTTYEITDIDTGVLTFSNLPLVSITGDKLYVTEYTVKLVSLGDIANLFVGQTIQFNTSNVYGVPSDNTATISSIDTEDGTFVLDSLPTDGIVVGDYIFRGTELWAMIRLVTSS